MEDLDKKWIWNDGGSCNFENQAFSKRLGLKNLEGIFILVAAGILSGIPLIVIELIYHRCKRRLGEGRSDSGNQQPRNNHLPSEVGETREGYGCCDREVTFKISCVEGTVLT